MYNFLTKYGQLVSLLIAVVLIVAFYLTASGGMEEFNMLPKSDWYSTKIFNIGLVGAIFLLVVALAAWVIFSLVNIIRNPKGSLLSLVSFVGLAVLFFIFYSTANGDVSAPLYEKFGVTSSQSKLISAGLNTTLVTLAGAVLAFFGSEVRNFFR